MQTQIMKFDNSVASSNAIFKPHCISPWYLKSPPWHWSAFLQQPYRRTLFSPSWQKGRVANCFAKRVHNYLGSEMYTKYVIYSCTLFMRGGSNMSVFEFLNHGICFVSADDFPTWSGSSVSFQYQSLCFFGRTAGYKLLESMTIMIPSQLKQKTSQLWYINLSKIPGEH